MSIFYTEVDSEVQKVLDARKSIYAQDLRTDAAHAWLYKKMAWGEAAAVDEKRKKQYSLKLSSAGGLGVNSLYTPDTSISDAIKKFFPKPHLVSITTSAEGDFGSILKAEIKFSVYTLTDLNNAQPFFTIGAKLFLAWGWQKAGTVGGSNGGFYGQIYNFTYSVNSTGGFDCTTYAMAPGMQLLGVDVNSLLLNTSDSSSNTKISVSSTGNAAKSAVAPGLSGFSLEVKRQKYTKLSFISNIKKTVINLTNSQQSYENGVLICKYNKDWAEAKDSETAKEFSSESEAHSYVTLERLVSEINSALSQSNAIGYIGCNNEITKGLFPKASEKLEFASANPSEILFPGFAKYSDTVEFIIPKTFEDRVKNEDDLSSTFISISWLEKTINDLGKDKPKHTKSADFSIANLLQKIFDLIYKHSGDRFKLTLTSPSYANNSSVNIDTNEISVKTHVPDKLKKYANYQLIIIDSNYIDDKQVIPYEITAVTKNSIVRNISLNSKVPQEFQAAAMVAATSIGTVSNSTTLSPITAGGRSNNTVNTQTETDIKQLLTDSISAIAEGITAERVRDLQAILKQKRESTSESNPVDFNKGFEAIPFPLDFTVTLDGINGFIFGNTITCNYLPAIYKTSNSFAAFTVTTVSHTIANGDWTTTLNTVFRLITQATPVNTDSEDLTFRAYNMQPNVAQTDNTGAKNYKEFTENKIKLKL